MKRIFFGFLFIFSFSFVLFAQEENWANVKSVALDAGLRFAPEDAGTGASIGIGFRIYQNNNPDAGRFYGWGIRNHILIDAIRVRDEDGVKNEMLMLVEKVSLGYINPNGLFRTYGFFKGGVGFYEKANKELFTMPLVFNLGYGFGIDIFAQKNTSLFLECGIDNHFLEKIIFEPNIGMGARFYL